MISTEQTIWAAAFSAWWNDHARAQNQLPPHIALGLSPINACRHACWQVRLFRGQLEEPTDEEALSMYREMQGKGESEKVSIQKEMVRGLIQFVEGRIAQVERPRSPNHDHEMHKLRMEQVSKELRALVSELRTLL